MWSPLPENFKNIDFLDHFKIFIKKWRSKSCPCRLCKVYIENVGFLYNKELCIISQNNILISKLNIFLFRFFSFLFHQKFNLSTALCGNLMCLSNTASAMVWFGMHDLLFSQDSRVNF